jgi:hypothetical protein
MSEPEVEITLRVSDSWSCFGPVRRPRCGSPRSWNGAPDFYRRSCFAGRLSIAGRIGKLITATLNTMPAAPRPGLFPGGAGYDQGVHGQNMTGQ